MNFAKRILFVALFSFFAISRLFGFSYEIEEFSSFKNPSFYEIAVKNGIIFAVSKEGVTIFREGSGKIPEKISFFEIDDKINAVSAKDSFLFLGGDKGLYIYDVKDIENPKKISFLATSDKIVGTDIEGDYLYAAYGEGVAVVDIYQKSSPKIVASYSTEGESSDLKVKDGYIFVADGEKGVLILSIDDSGSIKEVGSYESNGTADKIALKDNEAYVSYGSAGFRVIDISDPENPSLLFDCDGPSHHCFSMDIDVSKESDFVYILDKNSGLKVANVQDPSRVHLASEYRQLGESSAMAVDGDKIYIANKDTGIQIIDVSDGFHAKRVGYYESLKTPVKVDAKDDYLYVADYLGGFNVIDFSNPSFLKPISNVEIGCMAESVAVDRDRDIAYVTDFCKGLYIIDVSNKLSPKILSSLQTPGRAYDVKVYGNYAYIADRSYGLEIVDVKDPEAPFIVSSVPSSSYSISLDIDGNYAYVADYNDTLSVVDVFDPLNPKKVGSYDRDLGFAMDVRADKDFVYLADEGLGILLIDASDKENPKLDSAFAPGGDTPLYHAVGVDFRGNYLYGVYKNAGFAVANVSDKKALKEVKVFKAFGDMKDVKVYKDYVIVSDSGYGVRIYKTNIKEAIEEFIERVYTKLLRRDADLEGLNYYLNRLLKGDSAAEIEEIFFQSRELKSLNLSTEEFVKRTYETLLGREPDAQGGEYWKNMIDVNHIPRDIVFYKFITSEEFGNLAKEHFIVGYTMDDALKAFLERMYLLVLDRAADGAGMEFWFKALRDKTKSAKDIAADFFDSKEFKERNLNDEEFVKIAYRALMDREADKEGENFWLDFLKNHSRKELVREFINSKEFEDIAKEYGIRSK